MGSLEFSGNTLYSENGAHRGLWALAEPNGRISPPLKSRHCQMFTLHCLSSFPLEELRTIFPEVTSARLRAALCCYQPTFPKSKGINSRSPSPSEAWVTLMTNLVSYRSCSYLSQPVDSWEIAHTKKNCFQEHSRLSLVELTHLELSKDLAQWLRKKISPSFTAQVSNSTPTGFLEQCGWNTIYKLWELLLHRNVKSRQPSAFG